MSTRRSGNTTVFILIGLIAIIIYTRTRDEGSAPAGTSEAPPVSSAIDKALVPEPGPAERDGLAAAILLDVSGSMNERARDGSGQPKIVSARRAALDLVEQFARYADDNKSEPVRLGIYEFSGRDGLPDCREVIAMGPPDRGRAAEAIGRMTAGGGTPIGSAMIAGKRALDATGLSRRHLLVITDGENTTGPEPEDVAAAITRRPAAEQPSLYFVAFGISASRFDAVRSAGGLVLEAADAKALNDTLDSLLRGKILIER